MIHDNDEKTPEPKSTTSVKKKSPSEYDQCEYTQTWVKRRYQVVFVIHTSQIRETLRSYFRATKLFVNNYHASVITTYAIKNIEDCIMRSIQECSNTRHL